MDLATTFLLLVAALTFGGMGVEKNPHAPKAAEVQVYAAEQADYCLVFDVKAVVPPALTMLRALPEHAVVRDFPEAREEIRRMLGELEMGLGMVKSRTGIDFASDVDWLSVWLRFSEKGSDPEFLVTVRGSFAEDIVERLAKVSGAPIETVDGRARMTIRGGPMLARAADGMLLFGTPAWVEPRASSTWKPSKPKRGTLSADLKSLLGSGPFLALASKPSKNLRTQLIAGLQREPETAFLLDLLTGHEHFSVTLHHDGLGWAWTARDKEGLRVAEMGSRGFLDILRAGHLATRGFVRVFLAGLHSYEAADPRYAKLLQHVELLTRLTEKYTGDGQFDARVKVDKRKRKLTVQARGKRLAEVLPVGALVGAVGGAAAFFLIRDTGARPDGPTVEPAPEAP